MTTRSEYEYARKAGVPAEGMVVGCIRKGWIYKDHFYTKIGLTRVALPVADVPELRELER
jgi:hypothetical protein